MAKPEPGQTAALGFRAHSGWAAVVAVSGPPDSPVVVDRRRIEIADPAIASSKQPFHAARELPLPLAEKLIQRCADSTQALAHGALLKMIQELRQMHCEVLGACILLSSGRPVGSLESTLASHAMIHTAEGEFFREALRGASEKCGVPVSGVKEREIFSRAAAELRLPRQALQQRMLEMGKSFGPPWRQEEKLAALAGWLILATASQAVAAR